MLGKFHDCFKTSRLCTNPIKTVFHDVYWASFKPLDPTPVSPINIKQRGAVKWSRRGDGDGDGTLHRDRVFIRHRGSENSSFTTQNSLANVWEPLTIIYSDVEPLSKSYA